MSVDETRDLHERLMSVAKRLEGPYDTRPWTMLDATDEPVLTPCCGSPDWLEPLLLSARCGQCGHPWEPARLGVVQGVR